MRIADLLENENLEIDFSFEVMDHHHGQTEGVVIAYRPEKGKGFYWKEDKDRIYGFIQWASYDDKTYVQFIETRKAYRRQKIATKMVEFLRKQLDQPVVFTSTTDDGEKLHTYLKTNPELKKLFK